MAERADGAVPDPARLHTVVEWAAAMNRLRCGRSFGELDKAARRLPLSLGGPRRLPSSTLSDLLKGRTSRQTLEIYLAVCGVPRVETSAWLSAWGRIHTDVPPRRNAMRVRDTQPRHLGVHAAIEVDGAAGAVCEYVLRDADLSTHGVRAKLTAASQSGGFILLVGASSVGKTRSAFEALQAVLADWWLVHPVSTAEIDALAEDPPQQTVIWLDELQRYLDGLSLVTVRSLLQRASHPVVLIATLWPDRYSAYMRSPVHDHPDLTSVQREILQLAEVVHISETFTASETARAEQLARNDPRIHAALLASSEYGLPQTIAAVPMLVRRWENADPYARALLCAAVDATRLGFRSVLTAPLLSAAAPGYCQAKDRAAAPPNWFERSLAYATQLLHGATAALVPVAVDGLSMGRVDGYVLADFLLQHLTVRRRTVRPPASLWDAVLDHVRDPADVRRLADSAENRLLYQYAERLLKRAVEVKAPDPASGRHNAAWRLAALHFEQGRFEELRERAENSDHDAAAWAARGLAQRGEISEAVAVLRSHADSADVHTLWLTAEDLISQGEHQDAMSVLRVYTGEDDLYPVWRLAELLADEDEELELRTLAGTHASAKWHLARLLSRRQDRSRLTALAERDDASARWWLTELDSDGQPTPTLRALLGTAPRQAIRRYAQLLAETGRIDELQRRADAGEATMSEVLSGVLARQGDVEALRRRAEGDLDMLARLADLYRDRGEVEQLRELADGTDGLKTSIAGSRLAELLVDLGLEQELRARVDAGDFHAARELAHLLELQGRSEEAAGLRRYGLHADGAPVSAP
ncbi:hypothetical protein [Streptomyces sp. Root1310]|uniref:hypothetical protein n=1 Tax=Streptomyces sp. Root1310 TaxID=1736452 RepID=UPI0012FE8282|nr:hypothetical protein [Streptomyces sp. Root1310]